MLSQRERDKKTLIKRLEHYPYFVIKFVENNEGTLSPTTLLSYLRNFDSFFKWLMSEGLTDAESPKDITIDSLESLIRDDIEDYRRTLSTYLNNKKSTVNSKISALKTLFRYLSQTEDRATRKPYLTRNILEQVKLSEVKVTPSQKANRIRSKILMDDENSQFRDFVASGFGDLELSTRQKNWWLQNRERDTAIISLFLGSGIRIEELVQLTMKDTNTINRILSIIRKGDKEDAVYYSNKAQQDLDDYLKVRTERFNAPTVQEDPSFPLFVAIYDKKPTPMNKRSVQKMVKKYAEHFGKPELSPHMLRHSFATKFYGKTNNLLLVQTQLGHSSVQTTSQYAHISDTLIKDSLDEMDE